MGLGTLADWTAYGALRGLTVPAEGQVALQRAQDYISREYVLNFLPEYNVDSDGVEEAVYEAAALELVGGVVRPHPGFWSTTYTSGQQKVLTEVKGIKWTPLSVSASSTPSQAATPRSTTIEALLSRYMAETEGETRVGLWSIG